MSSVPLAAARPGPTFGRWLRRAGLRAAVWAGTRLPEPILLSLADVAGELWYRLAPSRAEQGRLNLQRVTRWLAEHGDASPRVRAAASDAAALERLVRSAFRHNARYYVEVVRSSALSMDVIADLADIDTPEALDGAFAYAAGSGAGAIFVGLHFGAIELPATYVASRSRVPVTAPMETVADPEIQAWIERTRRGTGIRIVGLREARRELTAALRRGEPVALVGDRDLTGGGVPTEFFGAPASLPAGPGLLAIETGATRVFVTTVRRAGQGRYRARVDVVEVPTDGSRRERLTAFLTAEARVFERHIALAPDQWWAIFFPIWPDLVAGSPKTDAR